MSDLINREDAIKEIHKYFIEKIEDTPIGIDEDGYEVYVDMATVNLLLTYNKYLSKRIKALPSVKILTTDIVNEQSNKFYKQYPESKDEDIVDAFMTGYLVGCETVNKLTEKYTDKEVEDNICPFHSKYDVI